LLPAASFGELIGDPFGRRMRGDPKPQDLPPAMAHDKQSIEQPERDRRNHEKVYRGDAVSMVAKKGLPSLRRRASLAGHILGDAGLADLDAELEQFAMDPRRSPQRIGNAHLADQPPYFGRNRRSAGTRS
jgi:hypothetical protein